jgi:hypothetical protein
MKRAKRQVSITLRNFFHNTGNSCGVLAMALLFLMTINIEALQFTKLFEFNYTNGDSPNELAISPDGRTLYGTTWAGNTNDDGLQIMLEPGQYSE